MDPKEYEEIVNMLYEEHVAREKYVTEYMRMLKYGTEMWEKGHEQLKKLYGRYPPMLQPDIRLPDNVDISEVVFFLGEDLNILSGLLYTEVITRDEFNEAMYKAAEAVRELNEKRFPPEKKTKTDK